MEALFIKLVEMSISASWLVLAVLLLRILLKKSPRWIHVALWAMVALRLVCPMSPESAVSLNPVELTDRILEDIPNSYVGASSSYWDHMPEYQEAVEAGAEPIYAGEGHYYVVTGKDHLTPALTLQQIAGWIWLAGVLGMAIHALISYRGVQKQVNASLELGNGVYLCDYIDTPFILGIFNPKIYLPSEMDPEAAGHVLAHERAHIARKDHWWKPFGYLLLSVYWFNPLLWLAYILLCRDIELACDEKVIRDMENHQKKAYSEALLKCSINRRMIAACPLAFGELGVKERVKSVLNYRKPAFWIVLVAVLASIVTGVCFLTEPVQRSDQQAMDWFENYAYENVRDRMDREEVLCIDAKEGYALVYCQGQGPMLTLYRYEKQGKDIVILDSCAGDYAISGGMSMNHLEDQGKHIYFGTASEYHWNPKAEVNTWIVWNHLTLTDTEGKRHKKDMLTNLKGFLFILDAPMQDFAVVDCLDTECLNMTKFIEQGYYMVEVEYESRKGAPESIPYDWTSNVAKWDIQKCWAYQGNARSLFTTIEGDELDKLIRLLNDVKQDEIISRGILGPGDPIWDYEAPSVDILCTDGVNIRLRYVYDTVIIMPDTEFARWETDGYWVIENDGLKQWVYALSLGGTEMLSEANRQEIRDLLRQEDVCFIHPQKYEDLLFVGCWYDGGRGMAVACYEPLADGYALRKLIRGTDIKTCASGDNLYYCDYEDLRIFLILNQSITGLEFAGEYRLSRNIDTHPGLAVVYYPENLNAMYRFHYGNASTMYMDWYNRTHAEPPQYESGALLNPDNASSLLSNLSLSDVEFIWASDIQNVDKFYDRAIAKDLSGRQMVELLNILRDLPGSAYEMAEYPDDVQRCLEICLLKFREEDEKAPWITLGLSEGTVYYRFRMESAHSYQTWEISNQELTEFLEKLFGDDTSDWTSFAPYPKADGEISFTWDDLEITVPRLLCFQYELVEEGIRFKPEDKDSWIELHYQQEPYAQYQKGSPPYPSVYGGWDAISGFHEGDESRWFMDITVPGETEFHVLLLYETENPWKLNYDREIYWMIDNLLAIPAG